MGWVKNSNYRVVRIIPQRFTHFESGDFRALVPAPRWCAFMPSIAKCCPISTSVATHYSAHAVDRIGAHAGRYRRVSVRHAALSPGRLPQWFGNDI